MATLKSSLVADSTNKLTATVAPTFVLPTWVHAEYTITAALALNDEIQMIKVAPGCRVLDVIVSTTDLDTGGSPAIVLDVGDGNDDDRYVADTTIGQAGGMTRLSAFAGHGYTYTAADTIDVSVSTAPQTGATSGTVKLSALLDYSGN